MARFYGTRVLDGKITIDEVPLKWKAATEIWIGNNR